MTHIILLKTNVEDYQQLFGEWLNTLKEPKELCFLYILFQMK